MNQFHPAVQTWFEDYFGEPTEPQRNGWPCIQQGRHVLIAAPTGSGKTLAAFLCALDQLVRRGSEGKLADETRVLYLSPLKALAHDVQKNLLEPLQGIYATAARMGIELPQIRPLVRTGDTLPAERQRMVKKPPHILVTTPESLFILLTSQGGRGFLKDVRTVIVDEIHALARDKRGSHLTLSLERLEALTGSPFQRIGLSATQKPIETVAEFLTGAGREAAVVDIGHRREMDLAVEVPRDELSAVASNEIWQEICDRIAGLVQEHSTTLIFVNTRRLAERMAHQLAERLSPGEVAAHHGSLSREIRLSVEGQLKQGELKAVVATASLELGIDVGSVDLVCQVGSTRSIALALQRIGRSGHWKGAVPKGRLFPITRDDLLECAALVWAMRRGELDRIQIPEAPLDILAQQVVAAAASRPWDEEELFRLVCRASPYRRLPREDFDAVLTFLAEGISTRRGREKAYLYRDRVNGRVRGRRGARLAAITSGGAIPDNADYLVKADPEEILVGTLDEDFAVESMRGDIFLLGNTSWRIRRVEAGVVRVEDAQGAPPSIPFWRGEAPGRTEELSRAVSEVRQRIAELDPEVALGWLQAECGLDRSGAEQAVEYVRAARSALGALPSHRTVVAERFFDESGGMQLVLHAPFGSRINRAWGLALRKRFCRSFNFELQAAATDNGILISLSDQHSFPLSAVFSFVTSPSAHELLEQALLASPLFTTRWRWTASRALAILRFSRGRKVPPPLQRLRSDDLLAAVFPQQAACLENIQGDIQIPQHPLVQETLRDCLFQAMDKEGFLELLRRMEEGEIECVAVDTREPSPFSHEILNSNAYTFLDDAPLEERRARAVHTRRSLSGKEAQAWGQLDEAAIQQVLEEVVFPKETPDEVHDLLLTLGVVPEEELQDSRSHLQILQESGRVLQLKVPPEKEAGNPGHFWLAAERIRLVSLAYPHGLLEPRPSRELRRRLETLWKRDQELDAEGALRELVRAHMECCGPVTAAELAARLALPGEMMERSLLALEGEGQVLRGSFRSQHQEWCDRRLLARIHRATLQRLRQEIQPVTPAEFQRFLFHWHHLLPGTQLHGRQGLALVLRQLQGYEAAAASWESFLLPQRVADFQPEELDHLCLSGEFVWGRFSHLPSREREGSEPEASRSVRPTRVAPITFFERRQMAEFLALRRLADPSQSQEGLLQRNLSHTAREVWDRLRRWGASFLPDLVRTTGRLPLEVEEGLWELVAAGLVTADGYDNLRALMDPRRRLRTRHQLRRKRSLPPPAAGRWTLLELPGRFDREEESVSEEKALEFLARQLLQRWGVMFRDLLARESLVSSWRDLLRVYRRLEARGEIRGGRFVSGFVGEQFALPQAVETLRSLRRTPTRDERVRISAADPLNLVGILLPGPRVRAHPETLLEFRNGTFLNEGETVAPPLRVRS